MVHAVAAALGLELLLQTSPIAFLLIKAIGAACYPIAVETCTLMLRMQPIHGFFLVAISSCKPPFEAQQGPLCRHSPWSNQSSQVP